jgi:hypothetical protein
MLCFVCIRNVYKYTIVRIPKLTNEKAIKKPPTSLQKLAAHFYLKSDTYIYLNGFYLYRINFIGIRMEYRHPYH